MEDVHGLTPQDLEDLLEMLPPFAELSKPRRITYLKLASALHTAREEGYFVRIKVELEGYNKVAAIKAYRQFTGYGLKESKDFVESGDHMGPFTFDAAQAVMKIFGDLGVGTEAIIA